ncbi:hypothetical protein GCM10011514_11130 [Emticicia aquatilis]|uniref:DUF4276 family protein n=1 Tax=Emticicia aquatilis TaxID=1537369 RepID=A0A916YJW7_9BACT|nr:DUF4276 family protein [Emticicia aquatilis]GGD48772.1 hypothetical protein GCM10011514_11130 [Emticicia aquatilis]
MVKVGFLVEGDTEKKIILSDNFKAYCQSRNIEILPSILPTKGQRGKDIFKNKEKIEAFIEILKDNGAEYIFVIRDLEDLTCVIDAKDEIASDEVNKIIVVKAIESWFLADTKAISSYFEQDSYYHDLPESIEKPFDYLKRQSIEIKKRGISDKLIFAGIMLKNGFSIENAAKHSNCQSAKYFIKKLESLKPLTPKGG